MSSLCYLLGRREGDVEGPEHLAHAGRGELLGAARPQEARDLHAREDHGGGQKLGGALVARLGSEHVPALPLQARHLEVSQADRARVVRRSEEPRDLLDGGLVQAALLEALRVVQRCLGA